ncbi:ArsS family sensor histidine kinase [Hydrogenimonas sp.]
MKNIRFRHSIFFKLNLIFLLAIIALVSTFVITVREIKIQQTRMLENHALDAEARIRKIILKSRNNLEKSLRKEGFWIIEHPEKINAKLTPLLQPPPPTIPLGLKRRIEDGRLRFYTDGTHLFIQLSGPKGSRMIATSIEAYRLKWIIVFFIGILSTIVLLYWTMRRSLKPLRKLAEQIQRFGEGDMSISTKSAKQDEIAFVANQFDAAAKKIRFMKEARTLFMRNIMHELKTPITKGKLGVALMEENDISNMLRRAFSRMEQLISEMAKVESITSKSLELQMKRCDLHKIIEDATTLLFVEPEKIRLSCQPCIIEADCEMMTIVIKNLIDNALKYGDDDKLDIHYTKGTLEVINKGKPLARDFKAMVEPFAKGLPDDTQKASNESFGLGLYIVKSILEAHGATLSHYYKKGRHHFVITGIRPAV